MNELSSSETQSDSTGGQDNLSALFGQLVLRQANMAAMLLGKVAHPETGKTVHDIESARLFIDELEMLEAKTRGNLTREETAFLKQTLMSLRLAFVEAVESAPREQSPKPPAEPAKPAAASNQAESAPDAAVSGETERHTKFSKKY